MFDFEVTDIKILKDNAAEYFEVMGLVKNNNYKPARQVLHNGHIAVELLLKAMLMKYIGKYPKTHEIKVLCQWDIPDGVGGNTNLFFTIFQSNYREQYRGIRSAWSMDDRYNAGSLSYTEAEGKYKTFEEVIKWIQTQC